MKRKKTGAVQGAPSSKSEKEKTEWGSSKSWQTVMAVPVMLAFAVIPLIVIVKKYDTGLTDQPWFSNSVSRIDLFLYWKGRALMLLAGLMLVLFAAYLVYSLKWKREIARGGSTGRQEAFLSLKKKFLRPEVLCTALYLVLAAVSAFLSGHRDFALFGSYEQWEGLNVLAAYVVLLLYTYLTAGTERMMRFFVYSLLVGSFFVGLIGTFQFFGRDFFRTELGQSVMNLLSDTKMNFSFNFQEGWVYTTLYNPNYVGSYAALLFPVIIASVCMKNNDRRAERSGLMKNNDRRAAAVQMPGKGFPVFFTVLAFVDLLLLTVTLFGSRSLTGVVSVLAGGIFILAYRAKRIIQSLGVKKAVSACVAVCAFLIVFAIMFPEPVHTGLEKLFKPKSDNIVTVSILSTDRGLRTETASGDVFYIQFVDDVNAPFEVQDEEGTKLDLKKDEAKGYFTPEDSRFSDFRLYQDTISLKGNNLLMLRMGNPSNGKIWKIIKINGVFRVVTKHNKIDYFREIPQFGFKNNQHFGDKRGYIWSRTFPLLGKYMLVGSGMDTFTEVFPNDDYVGKTNLNYDGVMVTKPHNMYLQIWVQSGFLSLLAFLAVFILYFVKAVRLYYRRTLESMAEKLGAALMVSCVSYMVAGLANDSTVAVAPLYWGILGLGMAVNHYVAERPDHN